MGIANRMSAEDFKEKIIKFKNLILNNLFSNKEVVRNLIANKKRLNKAKRNKWGFPYFQKR